MPTLAFISDLLAPQHMIILLIIALLIWGKRLPEVGRGLGRSIVEFKKGLKDINTEVDDAANQPPPAQRTQAPPPPTAQIDQNVYRPPLQPGGQDVRVSRADAVEPPHAQPQGQANPYQHPEDAPR